MICCLVSCCSAWERFFSYDAGNHYDAPKHRWTRKAMERVCRKIRPKFHPTKVALFEHVIRVEFNSLHSKLTFISTSELHPYLSWGRLCSPIQHWKMKVKKIHRVRGQETDRTSGWSDRGLVLVVTTMLLVVMTGSGGSRRVSLFKFLMVRCGGVVWCWW